MTNTKKSKAKTAKKSDKTVVKNLHKPHLYIIYLLIAIFAVFAAIFFRPKDHIVTEAFPIIHETKFGGVYIKSTIDDFNALGFKYGDSVDIEFSNGYTLKDIPYYNGYYVDIDEPLLIAYPGYDYIKAAVNYGDDLWNTAKLTTSDTAIISLNKREKYLDIQKASDLKYTDTQGSIPDTIFATSKMKSFSARPPLLIIPITALL